MSKKGNLKATMVKMTGISNQISLAYGSVIENIFKFRVDMVLEYLLFFTVSKQPQKTIHTLDNWLTVNRCAGKQVPFITSDYICLRSFLSLHTGL